VNLPLKIKYQQKLELRIFRQELRYGYRFFGGSDFESFLGEEMNQEESFLFLKIIYALTFNKNLFLPFFFLLVALFFIPFCPTCFSLRYYMVQDESRFLNLLDTRNGPLRNCQILVSEDF
jgi:hypothetical protein